jgi:photosystem II stability/assembly factor-like uncharacterized protein
MGNSNDGYALAVAPDLQGDTIELITTDGGVQWTPVKTLAAWSYYEQDIVAPDTQHAYFVSRTVVEGTSNGGRSWTTLYKSADALQAISFINSAEGWALGTNPTTRAGFILHTNDGGSHWSTLQAPCNPQLSGGLAFVNAQDGLVSCLMNPGAGTSPKTIYETTDGGAKWKVLASTGVGVPGGPSSTNSGLSVAGYVHTLFFLNREAGWLGVDRGSYFATTDGGVKWQPVWTTMFPPGNNSPSVGMLSSGFGWVVADMNADGLGNTLYVTTDQGKHWREVYPVKAPPPHQAQG